MFVYEVSGCGFKSRCNHLNFRDIAPGLSKEFHDIQETKESGFTLKRVRDMIGTYSTELMFSVVSADNTLDTKFEPMCTGTSSSGEIVTSFLDIQDLLTNNRFLVIIG